MKQTWLCMLIGLMFLVGPHAQAKAQSPSQGYPTAIEEIQDEDTETPTEVTEEAKLPLDPAYAGLREALDVFGKTDKTLFVKSAKPLQQRLIAITQEKSVSDALTLACHWLQTFTSSTPIDPQRVLSNTELVPLTDEQSELMQPLLLTLQAKVYLSISEGDSKEALGSAETLFHFFSVLICDDNDRVSCDEVARQTLALFLQHIAQFSTSDLRRLSALIEQAGENTENRIVSIRNRREKSLIHNRIVPTDPMDFYRQYGVPYREENFTNQKGKSCIRRVSLLTYEQIKPRFEQSFALLTRLYEEMIEQIRYPVATLILRRKEAQEEEAKEKLDEANAPPPETTQTEEKPDAAEPALPTVIGLPDDDWKVTFNNYYWRQVRDLARMIPSLAEINLALQLCRVHLAIEKYRREHDTLPTTILLLNQPNLTTDALANKPLLYTPDLATQTYTLSCTSGRENYSDGEQTPPDPILDLFESEQPDFFPDWANPAPPQESAEPE